MPTVRLTVLAVGFAYTLLQAQPEPVSLAALSLSSPGTDVATMTRVAVSDMPFDSAYRIDMKTVLENSWDAQASAVVQDLVASGDAMMVEVHVRSAAGSDADFVFRFEQVSSPWTGSTDRRIVAGPEWKRVLIPFAVQTPDGVDYYAPGHTALRFRVAGAVQTVDIGGVAMYDYGDIAIDSLEALAAAGRDTTWRAAAYDRIEQIRTGEFTVLVVGNNDSLVADAPLAISMNAHRFYWGGLGEDLLIQTGNDADNFRAKTLELFNSVTQRIYWAWNWTDAQGIADIFSCIEWAEDNGLRSRGHTVVYPTWQFSPSWLQSLENDPVALNDTIAAHVVECAVALEGRLDDWDVVNEAHHFTEVTDAAGGRDALERWYRLAAEHAPTVIPYVNEYGIIAGGGDAASITGYKALIQDLLDRGVPLGGIGMQGHCDGYAEPELLYGILDDFASFGLPIRITEMDVNVDNEQVQASELHDYMVVAFSHPAVIGLTLWGFWEGNMWNDRRGLVRQDWSDKPSALIWKKLIRERWWTPDVQTTSESHGAYRFSGFKGTYDITTRVGGRDSVFTVPLYESGDTAWLRVDTPGQVPLAARASRAGSGGKAVDAFRPSHRQPSVVLKALEDRGLEVCTIRGRRLTARRNGPVATGTWLYRNADGTVRRLVVTRSSWSTSQ